VSYIFDRGFFDKLKEDSGIDLENSVYYKDDTHYFVMTAKKQSLLQKGVIFQTVLLIYWQKRMLIMINYVNMQNKRLF
jgi:hypothetical protein